MDLITAQSYAGYTGFGEMPAASVDELQKALTAGSGTDAASFTNGRSLIVESLEQTLMTTTFSAEDIVLWKMLKSNPVYAVVDEWVEKSDYGSQYGVAVSETANPGARDTTYARKVGQVKFYRVQRELSHVMTLTRSIVDAEAEEQIDGTMLLLRALETALFYGDSSILPVEIDGLKKQIVTNGSSDNIIDVRGQIQETHLQQAARVIRGHFGTPTDLFLSLGNQSDIDRILDPKQRVMIPAVDAAGGIMAGLSVTQYRTSFGNFRLHPDVFINLATEDRAPFTSPEGGANAPAAPTTVTGANAPATGSLFTAADAGTYFYRVAYFTAAGESVGTATASITVNSGDGVTLTMNGGTTGTVSGAKIFRSKLNAADASDTLLIDTVAFTGTGQTYVDKNQNLPGASDMFLLNMSPNSRAISWQQLLPMMKLNLAIVGPSIPFLIMLYGYLRVTKAKQHCVLKNVRPSDHRFNS
jgi:hypothetical protein